jgi:CTP:molybdopterin cytidylyltransferase MocA
MITTNQRRVPNLNVVILAAGFSTRLGRPKALARVGGESLLRRTARLAAALGPRALMVVAPPRARRYHIELDGLRVQLVVNRQRSHGLASSVRAGTVRARWSAGVLFLPVDLANLRLAELVHLVARWRAAPRRAVARRIAGAARGGIPLILPKWLYGAALAATGDVGLREVLGRLPPACVALLDLPSARDDVDTAADLAAVRTARLRARAIAPGGSRPRSP